MEVAPDELDRSPKSDEIGPCDRHEDPVDVPDPRDDRPVVEPEDELHLHLDLPADALDDPNDVGLRLPRRHEVDEPHHALVRLEHRLEDERVAAIAPTCAAEIAVRLNRPVAVLLRADERCEARARVEAGKAEPLDAAVTVDEGGALQVAEERIVLDQRHQSSSRKLVYRRNRFAAARLNAFRYSSAGGPSSVDAYVSRRS